MSMESERYESGEEVWYDLNFKHNCRTGQLHETSMLAPGAEYYTERIKNKVSIPPKAALMDSCVQTEKSIVNSHAQTDPVSGLLHNITFL